MSEEVKFSGEQIKFPGEQVTFSGEQVKFSNKQIKFTNKQLSSKCEKIHVRMGHSTFKTLPSVLTTPARNSLCMPL